MSFNKELNKLQKQIHKEAKDRGWYDTDRSPLEMHMLMVSEIAEATEEARRGMPMLYYKNGQELGSEKPEGEGVELADLFIRLLDYCEYRAFDLAQAVETKMEFNKTRSYRHGNKKY